MYAPLGHALAGLSRTVPWGILLLLSFCWDPETAKRAETIRQEVDLNTLQHWAVQMLEEYPGGRTFELKDLPPIVRSIPSFGFAGPFVNMSRQAPKDDRAVFIRYIGSFDFYWSLEVGSPKYRRQTNRRCIELIPGVYYTER